MRIPSRFLRLRRAPRAQHPTPAERLALKEAGLRVCAAELELRRAHLDLQIALRDRERLQLQLRFNEAHS